MIQGLCHPDQTAFQFPWYTEIVTTRLAKRALARCNLSYFYGVYCLLACYRNGVLAASQMVLAQMQVWPRMDGCRGDMPPGSKLAVSVIDHDISHQGLGNPFFQFGQAPQSSPCLHEWNW